MDKKTLVLLYEKFGSIGKVAAHLCKPYSTVRHWYFKHEIEVQESCMTIFNEIRNTPMSSQQKSVVLGSLLGDGNLRLAPHSKNSILRIGHCERQLDYLIWKNTVLKPFSRNIKLDQTGKIKYIGKYECKSTNFYRFNTIAHPDITFFYKKYVVGNKKSIISDVIDELDLISMSIWFADDGSVYYDKRNGVITCSIATNSFSYKEQLILVEALRKFFKGTIKISKQGNSGREDFYIRMFKTKYNTEFLDNIKLVLPECIHYKLGPQRLGVGLPKWDEGIVRTT
jgi:hypothetical protein